MEEREKRKAGGRGRKKERRKEKSKERKKERGDKE